MSHAVEILLGRLYHLGVNYFLLEAAFMSTSPETTPDTDANVTQSLRIKARKPDLCVCVYLSPSSLASCRLYLIHLCSPTQPSVHLSQGIMGNVVFDTSLFSLSWHIRR